MKISFKLKVIASYITIVVVSFGLMAFFVDRSLERYTSRDITRSLIIRAQLIASRIAPSAFTVPTAPDAPSDPAASLGRMAQARVTFITPAGAVMADSEQNPAETARMENHHDRPEVRTAMAGAIGIDTRYSRTLKKDMLYVAVPVVADGRVAGVVRLSMALTAVDEILGSIRWTIFAAFAAALLLATLLGWLLASRTITPINRMIQTARNFSSGDFTKRIVGHPHDEMGELARTLNTMAQRIEDMMRESSSQNQKLTAIFNSMIEGVIVVDERGLIHSINRAVETMFSITQQAVRGRAFLEAIRNNDIAEVIGSVLRSGRVTSAEMQLVLPVKRTFQISAAPVFAHEKVSGCLVVIHDITEMRRLETMRRDFVANVSHELKTPLTSIKGFVETLLSGALDDKENNRSFLKIIEEHADRLNDLTNDLLELSHLESADIAIERAPVPLRELVDKVLRGFGARIAQHGLTSIVDIPRDFILTADPQRIEQVLTNLIDNAVKFNRPGGSIRIEAGSDESVARVTVVDSGAGIPERDTPRIFERFYRVDKARSRKMGGTGLGLAIVKHIIELHGGFVGVESTEGHGSRFWFTIPL